MTARPTARRLSAPSRVALCVPFRSALGIFLPALHVAFHLAFHVAFHLAFHLVEANLPARRHLRFHNVRRPISWKRICLPVVTFASTECGDVGAVR